ncbi:MAG: MATE family efflux transporter [Lachnospiraceae bacterium]|nr:MATE family efflux transporter [Lachnospiraceae bacterium]
MKKAMTREERYTMMIETPVNKLIPKLAVPTIISMLVTSIYNMADTFFVSQISTSASAAVGIIFSIMAMIQALGFTLGMGSGNCISRTLGSRDDERAERIAATGFITALIVGAVLAIGGISMLDPLVRFLGATDTIVPYAKDYAFFILLAAPVMMGSFVLNNLLRAQGYAFYSMIGITTGGILNMILDPILIFGLDMGIRGAALATAMSQCVSFGLLLYQTSTREGCIRMKLSKFTPKLSMYGPILHAGVPSLCRQGLASVATIVLNVAANPFGDAAIAAMSIVSRYMMFINSALIGFGQGFQPVCGFNFGAKRFDRVLESFWFCLKVAVILLTTLGAISFIGAEQILTLFRRDDLEVIAIGTVALRFQCMTMPLQAWIIMSNMLTQSIGYGFRASILSSGRQGICLIPPLLILPGMIGLLGLQSAQAISDVLTSLIAVVIMVQVLGELKTKANEQAEKPLRNKKTQKKL